MNTAAAQQTAQHIRDFVQKRLIIVKKLLQNCK